MNRYKLHEPAAPRFKFKEGDRIRCIERGNPYFNKKGIVWSCDNDAHGNFGQFACIQWDGERDVCVGQSVSKYALVDPFSIGERLRHIMTKDVLITLVERKTIDGEPGYVYNRGEYDPAHSRFEAKIDDLMERYEPLSHS